MVIGFTHPTWNVALDCEDLSSGDELETRHHEMKTPAHGAYSSILPEIIIIIVIIVE